MSNQQKNNHDKLATLLAWELIRIFSSEQLKNDYFTNFPLDKDSTRSVYGNHANTVGGKDEPRID